VDSGFGMKISLAVPSLDYGRYLGECLESIRTQDHPDLEVLIADGGSTDESLEVAERYAAADGRFRIVSRADEGQADAVQRAFIASSGDVFGYLNADDRYVRSDALSLVAGVFARHADVGVVSLGGCYLGKDGSRMRRVRLRYHPLDGPHLMRYRTAVLQPATFWRREVQEAVPLRNDLRFTFDAWFFYDVHERFKWWYGEEEIAGYRLHGSNKSVGVRSERIDELASLERHKFGVRTLRGSYLDAIARVARACERLPARGRVAKRGIHVVVNGLSYLTAYRMPGI
jgi:glycosyltransferase involved in cell wall biosynthesis